MRRTTSVGSIAGAACGGGAELGTLWAASGSAQVTRIESARQGAIARGELGRRETARRHYTSIAALLGRGLELFSLGRAGSKGATVRGRTSRSLRWIVLGPGTHLAAALAKHRARAEGRAGGLPRSGRCGTLPPPPLAPQPFPDPGRR